MRKEIETKLSDLRNARVQVQYAIKELSSQAISLNNIQSAQQCVGFLNALIGNIDTEKNCLEMELEKLPKEDSKDATPSSA